MVHARGFAQIGRDPYEGLVEAEGHVPGLRGENREDRRAFVAEQTAGKERSREHRQHDREKTEDRHRLQDVEHGDQQLFRAPAFGREGRISKAE